MSKIQTPAMVKINKKRKGQKYGQTPLKGAWHRLVRNKMSVVGMVNHRTFTAYGDFLQIL